MRPSANEFEDLFARLRELTVPVKGQDPLRDLQHRLSEALRRDAAGSPVPDGFPTQSGGGGSSDISRPTENAVLGMFKPVDRSQPDGRMVQRLPKDPIRQDVENAWAFLQQAVDSLKACRTRLDHIEDTTGKPPPQESCSSCIRIGVSVPMEHFTNVNGRLPQHYRLCDYCRTWLYKHKDHLGLPPIPLLERWHMVGDKGRVRMMRTKRAS